MSQKMKMRKMIMRKIQISCQENFLTNFCQQSYFLIVRMLISLQEENSRHCGRTLSLKACLWEVGQISSSLAFSMGFSFLWIHLMNHLLLFSFFVIHLKAICAFLKSFLFSFFCFLFFLVLLVVLLVYELVVAYLVILLFYCLS